MVLDDSMSNLTSAISNEASISSSSNINEMGTNLYPPLHPPNAQKQPPTRKKRNLPGNPDPEAEVVALSPKSLMATNRFLCEICNKGFQRDQNLQLHRRGHNLPWKLKQRSKMEIPKKKVYVCPEPSCVHHDPARALGDLTGIKKHFFRKHGEKKWKCEKCSKRYAVQSDWKAHSKICGTREYRCDCGTLFSRRDSFITHRAFCDALAQETSRPITIQNSIFSPQTGPNQTTQIQGFSHPLNLISLKQESQNFTIPPWLSADQQSSGPFFNSPRVEQSIQGNPNPNPNPNNNNVLFTSLLSSPNASSSLMSATALLQKAAQMGVTMSSKMPTQSSEQSILIRPHHHVGAPGGFVSTSSTPPTAVLHSRDEMGTGFFHGLAASSFGNNVNKLVNGPDGCMDLQDINLMASASLPSTSGFDGSALAFDGSFDAMMNPRRNIDAFQDNAQLLNAMKGGGGGGGGASSSGAGGGNDGLTRDFLGLRGFPHRNFVNMAGLGQMGSSPFDHQPTGNQDPWQS